MTGSLARAAVIATEIWKLGVSQGIPVVSSSRGFNDVLSGRDREFGDKEEDISSMS